MVISKVEFVNAMKEVNTAFAKSAEAVEALTARVAELEEAAKPVAKKPAAAKKV